MSALCLSHSAIRRGRRRVLEAAILEFPLPCATAVVGVNGSGKTSLFMCLTGSLHRHAGRGRVAVEHRTARLAVVPQEPAFPRWLTVERVAALYGDSWPDLMQRFPELYLDELAGRRAGALSVGQRQTLAIALALARDADVTFLDEPFSALDFRRRIGALDLLRRARAQSSSRAYVLSSQSAADLIGLCDHYVVLRDGRYIFRGTEEDLAERSDRGDLERGLLRMLL